MIMAMARPRCSVVVQQLLTCCTLMLLCARPVAPASRGLMSPASAPTASPAPTSPASAPTVTPAPTSPAPAQALSPANPTTPAPAPAPAAPLIWNVEYILRAPDCRQHGMIGINGQFPGPTITARAGDRIVVVVNNHLHTEGVVIHWHGIRQLGTPWADGTASISQCAINPGESFTYEFWADKPGTFFYHGHFGMQRAAGLYGSLIVNVKEGEEEPFKYDGELNMLLSDWYHEAVYAQEAGLDSKQFKWIGDPQTILINGSGQFDCTLGKVGKFQKGIRSDAVTCDASDGKKMEGECGKGECGADRKKAEEECRKQDCSGMGGEEKKVCEEGCRKKAEVAEAQCEVSCEKIKRGVCGPFCRDTKCGPVVYDVEPGKTYRLRIASTTSLVALNVQVQGHKLRVVEADGNYVDPFDVDDIDIYSGESYSVLLLKKTDTSFKGPSYWISVGMRGDKPKTLPALAILRYSNSDGSLLLPTDDPPETPAWDDVDRSRAFNYRINASSKQMPPEPMVNKTIFMLNTQNTLQDGHVKWAVNHVSLALPATPYLGAYYAGMERDVFDTEEAPHDFNHHYNISKPATQQVGEGNITTTVRNRVYQFARDDVVDVVIQNSNMLRENTSEAHPWHLHGHDFWILGYGTGRYDDLDGSKVVQKLNTTHPPLRNTVVLFPSGWTWIRFVANNPGVWAFHCHIEPHLHMGMGVIFAEGMETLHEMKEKMPKEAFMCGPLSRRASVMLPPAASPAP